MRYRVVAVIAVSLVAVSVTVPVVISVFAWHLVFYLGRHSLIYPGVLGPVVGFSIPMAAILVTVLLTTTSTVKLHPRSDEKTDPTPKEIEVFLRKARYRWRIVSFLWIGTSALVAGYFTLCYGFGLGCMAAVVLGLIAFILAHGGIFLFTIGCVYYAKSKGRSGAYGLLGLLWLLGGLILLFLPDRLMLDSSSLSQDSSSVRGMGTTNSRNA